MITYDDFKKVEIRAGKILLAEKIPDTDKLVKLMVDFGEQKEVQNESGVVGEGQPIIAGPDNPPVDAVSEPVSAPTPAPVFVAAPRQIVSGISMYFPDPAVLVGKTCMFVTNLEPRMIKGHESNGMLFAVSTGDGAFSLLEPHDKIPPGTRAA